MTRKEWLEQAINVLRYDFNQIDETIPESISIFPSWANDGYPRTYLGLCVHYRLSGVLKIYIAPNIDSGLDVLQILVHELIHCVVGGREGHGEQFQKVSKAIGLNGAARVAEDVLLRRLKEIQEVLGSYPLVLDFAEGVEV